MMAEIIPFPSPVRTDEYFGGCPECGQAEEHFNRGPNHYGACNTHQTCWWFGSNLFSSWRDETQEIWDANAARFAGYASVDPIYPPPDGKELAAPAEIDWSADWEPF